MPFFLNYPKVDYYFGKEEFTAKTPSLIQYTDIIDAVKLNSVFYTEYNVQRSERPDNLSQKLYGTPFYHWTFALMNDHIRESGWPLDDLALEKRVGEAHPNTVLVTREEIYDKFLVGSTVTGLTSAETGTIIHRNLQLGQIFIEGVKSFTDGETLTTTENDVLQTLVLNDSTTEALAALYYKDPTETNVVEVSPFDGPGSNVKTSYYDHYVDRNEELRQIRVIKPGDVEEVVRAFKKVMTDG